MLNLRFEIRRFLLIWADYYSPYFYYELGWLNIKERKIEWSIFKQKYPVTNSKVPWTNI